MMNNKKIAPPLLIFFIISLCINIVFTIRYNIPEKVYRTIVEQNPKPLSYETSAYMGRTSLFDVLEYPDTVDILFLGDSHTERADFQTTFKGKVVVQQGIGCDTSKGLLNRINLTESFIPKVIFLEIGINDLMQGESIDTITCNYETILEKLRLQHPTSRVYVETIYPISRSFEDNIQFYATRENIQEVNERIIQISKKKGCELLDTYKILSDEKGYLKDEYSCDGLHLTGAGYLALITEMEDNLK